jgi:hypothetical protein
MYWERLLVVRAELGDVHMMHRLTLEYNGVYFVISNI